jgi:hypothetical protein
MKYLMLIYQAEAAVSEKERGACYAESTAFAHELSAKGKYVAAAPLHPVSTATSVRRSEGKPVVTDGPFAETREQLGGFFMVEARDLDEAIEIASKIPGGKWGTVEIRPVMEVTGLPEDRLWAKHVEIGGTHST